jgi:tryptophanyl-tRNA synthetase
MTKRTVFSGIQPSSDSLTLGNYLGALKRFADYQTVDDALYCVVDLHAITVRQDPTQLRERTYAVAAWYLAAGLDPEKCTLFVQGHVRAHSELAWILATYTQMGEMERMTQFKDKAARHSHNINVGLFTYPILMAADILLYDTHVVPVGDDQKQHIEITRDIAQRFNSTYGEVFTIPQHVIPLVGARVMDLQTPTAKMSKSVEGQGSVFLLDSPDDIAKKIKRAVTDTLNTIRADADVQPGVTNLLGIFAACTGLTLTQAEAHFAGQQYGALKAGVADAVLNALVPLQQRYKALMADKAELDRLLHTGADKARARADRKLAQVRQAVGFIA